MTSLAFFHSVSSLTQHTQELTVDSLDKVGQGWSALSFLDAEPVLLSGVQHLVLASDIIRHQLHSQLHDFSPGFFTEIIHHSISVIIIRRLGVPFLLPRNFSVSPLVLLVGQLHTVQLVELGVDRTRRS